MLVKGFPIALEKRPKLLGLIFSTTFNSAPHIDDQRGKISSRIQMMKAISGTNFVNTFHSEYLGVVAQHKPRVSLHQTPAVDAECGDVLNHWIPQDVISRAPLC
jgi:hypothetical protein